jgi:DNA-binding HxlR family transcriptional regulator
MEVTKIDNQSIILKNKIEVFFKRSIENRKEKNFCITKDVMSVVTDKWSLFVIYNLAYYETLRFGELNSNIREVSSRMLSVTLKKLESHQIIERKAYAEIPPRVEYKLTAFGKELAEKAVDLNSWFLDKYLVTVPK